MTKDQDHLDYLNKYLSDYFPHYRIVWSEDQFEHRHGTFVTYHPIFSQITEVRKVPKYNWLSPCYILETKAISTVEEIKDHNGWDIAFPFIDMNGDAAFPDMESVQFMMNELVNHSGKRSLPTEKHAEEAENKAFDQEVKEIEERLGE